LVELTDEWQPEADLGGPGLGNAGLGDAGLSNADLGDAGLSGAGWAEADFRDFVAARSAALYRGALVLTGSRETAEDLVQETLERAWSRWRTVAAKDVPDAYVRRIMVNLANDRWRKFRRTVVHRDDMRQGDGDVAAPGDEYARVDSRDQLIRALQELPMRMRTVVVLRYFHNLSDAEIASDLGISRGAVRSQLARGIGRLRRQLPALSGPSPRRPTGGSR
jgi:RNA polymerase sigma-70 factor (sigma-E family)